MSEMKITFKHPDEILDFVNTVSKYEFDMDMKKGHVVVDAKSLLGIMHLGINNEIALQMYTDDCEELCREICSIRNFMFKEMCMKGCPNLEITILQIKHE